MKSKYIVPALFALYLILGWQLVPDYGISWDETTQRRHGLYAYDHVVRTLGLDWPLYFPEQHLDRSPGRQYTVLFPLTLTLLEKALGLEDDFRGQHLLRHRAVFLCFWLGTVFFYALLRRRFGDYRFTLLGVGLLLLSPRIFGHSFFNTKDIILLAAYIVSGYTMYRLLTERRPRFSLWHALATAVVINIRIAGVIIPALTLGFALIDMVQHPEHRRAHLRSLAVYVPVAAALTFLFFPYLWIDPVDHSVESFQMMANFPWDWVTLYRGEFVVGTEIPWHYIPVWIGITTPPFYLLCLVVGVGVVILGLPRSLRQKRIWTDDRQLWDLLMLALLAGPLCAVWLLDSTLYDGWRQIFFIYPPLLALALTGLWTWLGQKRKFWKYLAVAALLWTVIDVGRFMVLAHPLQHVYFNRLAGPDPAYHYEMDYWGVGYKEAFERLPQRDTSSLIQVFCANQPCVDNFNFLPEEKRERLKLRWGMEVADYYFSNFRHQGDHGRFVRKEYPYNHEFLIIDALGDPVIGVYAVQPAPGH